MEGVIYKPIEEYHDKLEPIVNYRDMQAHIIHTMRKEPMEVATKMANNMIKENYKKRFVTTSYRKENGDTILIKKDFFKYISEHVKQNNVIVPTMTTYKPATVERSKWSAFTLGNVILRAAEKKEAQAAFNRGDIDVANFKEGSQNNQKTKNNTLSGLYLSPGSVLYNPTAHQTLTSMTRTMTSLTNACNERLLTGNRALLTPEYALNSVVNEATYCNKELIRQAIDKYNLHVPTTDEVITMLLRSSEIYNRDMHYYRKYIIPYVSMLTDEERAGVMYTIDLFHTWVYNDDFVRTLLNKLTWKCTDKTEPLEDISVMKGIDQSIVYFAHNIFSDDIKGMGKEYDKFNKAGVLNNLYHTCLNIINVMQEYKLFFNAFFMTDIRPINSHRMGYVRRRSVDLSDTDSSGFDNQVLLKAYRKGNFDFGTCVHEMLNYFSVDSESIALTGAVVYLSSESIVHQLSRLSCTMNVERKELRRISMKNEWFWNVFSITPATKHYYADAYIQEGNVLGKTKRETKGVGLIANDIPKDIWQRTFDLMGTTLHQIRDHGKVNLNDLLREALDIEKQLIDGILSGNTAYLGTINIQPAEAYKLEPLKTPYRNHHLWKHVFEPKYGHINEPSYLALKLPTTLNSKRKFNEWLDGIEDKEFVNRMVQWCKVANRNHIPLFQIELEYVRTNGIPEEIKKCLDIETIVLRLTTQLKTIMSTWGLMVDNTKLLKDQFIETELV